MCRIETADRILKLLIVSVQMFSKCSSNKWHRQLTIWKNTIPPLLQINKYFYIEFTNGVGSFWVSPKITSNAPTCSIYSIYVYICICSQHTSKGHRQQRHWEWFDVILSLRSFNNVLRTCSYDREWINETYRGKRCAVPHVERDILIITKCDSRLLGVFGGYVDY